MKGKTTPCRHVSAPSQTFIINIGFDVQGNLYTAGYYYDSNNNVIPLFGVIHGPGCAATGITNLTIANPDAYGHPQGFKVAPSGNIAILGDHTPTIFSYAPPVNGSLGAPIATTPLNTNLSTYNFAFSQEGEFVYASDWAAGDVKAYAYPAGGTAVRTIGAPNSLSFGVVVTPVPR